MLKPAQEKKYVALLRKDGRFEVKKATDIRGHLFGSARGAAARYGNSGQFDLPFHFQQIPGCCGVIDMYGLGPISPVEEAVLALSLKNWADAPAAFTTTTAVFPGDKDIHAAMLGRIGFQKVYRGFNYQHGTNNVTLWVYPASKPRRTEYTDDYDHY